MSHVLLIVVFFFSFFFNDTATTEIYTLSLHDALPIWPCCPGTPGRCWRRRRSRNAPRSEEHTSELQSLTNLVCRLLLEKKNKKRHQSPRGLPVSLYPLIATITRGA